MGDRHQPPAKVELVPVKLRKTSEHPNKHLRGQILRVMGLAGLQLAVDHLYMIQYRTETAPWSPAFAV